MPNMTFADIPVGEFFTAHPHGQFQGEVFKKLPLVSMTRDPASDEVLVNAIALWEKNPNDTFFYHFEDVLHVKKTDVNGYEKERHLVEL